MRKESAELELNNANRKNVELWLKTIWQQQREKQKRIIANRVSHRHMNAHKNDEETAKKSRTNSINQSFTILLFSVASIFNSSVIASVAPFLSALEIYLTRPAPSALDSKALNFNLILDSVRMVFLFATVIWMKHLFQFFQCLWFDSVHSLLLCYGHDFVAFRYEHIFHTCGHRFIHEHNVVQIYRGHGAFSDLFFW